jgi:hypothetical protein
MAWWGFCAVRVAVPLGALALLPWAPLPAIALAWGLGVVSIAAGSAVRPPGTAVTGWKDLLDWQGVDPACRLLTRSWPALGSLAEPRDIGPTVARARYEIATLLAARAALRKPLDELRGAPRGLAADDPLRTEVGAWGDELLARQRALTEQIGSRIAALQRLAARTSEFAHEQAAAERARQALRRASTAAGTVANLPTLDAVRDIDERTQAVFDAYRELAAEFTPAS